MTQTYYNQHAQSFIDDTLTVAMDALYAPFVAMLPQQATTVAAVVLQQEGALGCIRAGAIADILVVNGNPLDDIQCLVGRGDGACLSHIMQGGKLVKQPA